MTMGLDDISIYTNIKTNNTTLVMLKKNLLYSMLARHIQLSRVRHLLKTKKIITLIDYQYFRNTIKCHISAIIYLNHKVPNDWIISLFLYVLFYFYC